MNAREYYLALQKAIHAAPHVLRSDMHFWDNAPHHRDVSTFPDHCHDRAGVHVSPPMDVPGVLNAIVQFIMPPQADHGDPDCDAP